MTKTQKRTLRRAFQSIESLTSGLQKEVEILQQENARLLEANRILGEENRSLKATTTNSLAS